VNRQVCTLDTNIKDKKEEKTTTTKQNNKTKQQYTVALPHRSSIQYPIFFLLFLLLSFFLSYIRLSG